MDIEQAWEMGRKAVAVLEAEPADPDHGYTPNEVAQQYAAVDRLVEAFRTLDKELTRQAVKP